MILCAGEALIDMIPAETTAGETGYVPRAGGAVYNTAVALGRLGAQVSLATGLSTDAFGALLEEVAGASGVDCAPSPRVNRPTTLAMVTLSGGQASYAFYMRGTAMNDLTGAELTAPDPLPEMAVFGGISLMAEPCGAAFEALCLSLVAKGVPIFLDPNIRPGFIADEAAYRARLARMMAVADIVKLSDEDLLWLAGPDAAPGDILAQGPAVLCLTRGAEGAEAVTARGTLHVPARAVTVADTVGAGDTFNAGVLASLQAQGLRGRDAVRGASDAALEAALSLGIAAASVTVSRAGANPPWRSELPA
ncbi:carbohydrate kinase family protein [Pseudooceanicola sp. 502str34]